MGLELSEVRKSDIRGSQIGVDEDKSSLGCEAVSLVEYFSAFRSTVLP
jgi:hypothetical protein